MFCLHCLLPGLNIAGLEPRPLPITLVQAKPYYKKQNTCYKTFTGVG